MKIGLSLNGVVIPYHNNRPRNESELYATRPVPGAFEGIKTLVERFGASHIFILSAFRPETKDVALNWLKLHDIYGHTGFAMTGQFTFCSKSTDLASLAKKQRLDLFSDVQESTLSSMKGKIEKRCLFGAQAKEPADSEIILTPTWDDLLRVALG